MCPSAIGPTPTVTLPLPPPPAALTCATATTRQDDGRRSSPASLLPPRATPATSTMTLSLSRRRRRPAASTCRRRRTARAAPRHLTPSAVTLTTCTRHRHRPARTLHELICAPVLGHCFVTSLPAATPQLLLMSLCVNLIGLE